MPTIRVDFGGLRANETIPEFVKGHPDRGFLRTMLDSIDDY
jgi:hypothetical protein